MKTYLADLNKNYNFCLITLLFFTLQYHCYSQKVNYSQLEISSENLKEYLFNSDDYYSAGNDDLPYFQGKNDQLNIRFYKSTGPFVIFSFESERMFLELVREIQKKATLRFKYCTDYDEPIVYNYKTYNGNKIRFNFNESSISVEYPSELNAFMDRNSDILPVFVCVSEVAYAYHTNLRCGGLGNCKAQITKTDIRGARKYGYKICEICTDDRYEKNIINEVLKNND